MRIAAEKVPASVAWVFHRESAIHSQGRSGTSQISRQSQLTIADDVSRQQNKRRRTGYSNASLRHAYYYLQPSPVTTFYEIAWVVAVGGTAPRLGQQTEECLPGPVPFWFCCTLHTALASLICDCHVLFFAYFHPSSRPPLLSSHSHELPVGMHCLQSPYLTWRRRRMITLRTIIKRQQPDTHVLCAGNLTAV